MATTSESYLLLVRDTTPEVYETMSPDERRKALDRWNAWVDGMAERGKLRDGQPLQSGGRLISGARGQRVTDGPFAESKEVTGGFAIIEVESRARAIELARQFLAIHAKVMGPSYAMDSEVRQMFPATEFSHKTHELNV